MKSKYSLTLLATAAVLATAPAFAQQRDGMPGNPPSTVTGRAVDRMQNEVPQPDSTPGNPPGTALGRATDRALDTNMSGASPQAGNQPLEANTTRRPDGTVVTTTTGAPAAAVPASGMTAAEVDAEAVRGGLRASKIIGSNVYTDANDSIGEVEDLIVPPQGGQPVAVLSVGGFLGIGAKRVGVPFAQLQYNADRERWMLPGATKESLQARPNFAYAEERRGGARDAETGANGAAPGSAAGGGAERMAVPPPPARQQ